MNTSLDSWINLALRAPSGDNCQPWDITFYENQFKISINRERAKHFLDQNESASWISIGCLCENLRLSAGLFGFSCSITLDSEASVMINYIKVPSVNNPDLLESILKRQTFRGKLDDVTLNLIAYQNAYKNTLGHGQFEWKIVKDVSRKLIWQWGWLEALLWLKTPLMRDFTKYLRIKNENFDDGLSLKNLQISFIDRISLIAFKKIPALIHLMPFYFFEFKSYLRLKFLVEKSSGLLLLMGPFNQYEDYFYAGMEIQRMWLFMTENKIKSQPIAIQSLFLNFVNSKMNQQVLTVNDIKRIENIKKQTYMDLQITQNLIFAFRFGKSNNEIPLLPRRALKNNI